MEVRVIREFATLGAAIASVPRGEGAVISSVEGSRSKLLYAAPCGYVVDVTGRHAFDDDHCRYCRRRVVADVCAGRLRCEHSTSCLVVELLGPCLDTGCEYHIDYVLTEERARELMDGEYIEVP